MATQTTSAAPPPYSGGALIFSKTIFTPPDRIVGRKIRVYRPTLSGRILQLSNEWRYLSFRRRNQRPPNGVGRLNRARRVYGVCGPTVSPEKRSNARVRRLEKLSKSRRMFFTRPFVRTNWVISASGEGGSRGGGCFVKSARGINKKFTTWADRLAPKRRKTNAKIRILKRVRRTISIHYDARGKLFRITRIRPFVFCSLPGGGGVPFWSNFNNFGR